MAQGWAEVNSERLIPEHPDFRRLATDTVRLLGESKLELAYPPSILEGALRVNNHSPAVAQAVVPIAIEAIPKISRIMFQLTADATHRGDNAPPELVVALSQGLVARTQDWLNGKLEEASLHLRRLVELNICSAILQPFAVTLAGVVANMPTDEASPDLLWNLTTVTATLRS